MGLLSSAVDAIIVCYAEVSPLGGHFASFLLLGSPLRACNATFYPSKAPKELEESHPKVAQEMSRTWTEAWGSQAGVVLVSLGGGLGIV